MRSIYFAWLNRDTTEPGWASTYTQWIDANHRKFTTEELKKEQMKWQNDIKTTLEKIIKIREKEELINLWIE